MAGEPNLPRLYVLRPMSHVRARPSQSQNKVLITDLHCWAGLARQKMLKTAIGLSSLGAGRIAKTGPSRLNLNSTIIISQLKYEFGE